MFRQKVSPAKVHEVISLLFFFLLLNNFIIFLRKTPLYLLSGWMTCGNVYITLLTSPSSPHLSEVHGTKPLTSWDTATALPLPVMSRAGHCLLYTIPFLFSCKKKQPLIVYKTDENTALHKIPTGAPTFCIEMHSFQGSNECIPEA